MSSRQSGGTSWEKKCEQKTAKGNKTAFPNERCGSGMRLLQISQSKIQHEQTENRGTASVVFSVPDGRRPAEQILKEAGSLFLAFVLDQVRFSSAGSP